MAENDTRVDGRPPRTLRPVSTERSFLQNADGSGKWIQGKTNVVAAVYGPRSIAARKEHYAHATIEVVFRPATGTAGGPEREFESFLLEMLKNIIITTQYPRSGIQVVWQVECDDGALLSSAVNASCMALIDAGIALRTVVASASCAIVQGPKRIFLDPCSEEETGASGTLTAVVDCNPAPEENAKARRDIVGVRSDGAITEKSLLVSVELCRATAKHLFGIIRHSAEKYFEGISRAVG